MKLKTSKKLSTPLGASFIVLSSFFYASYGIWTKLLGDFFDGYVASALRSILVVLILIPIAFCYRKFEPLHLRKNWLQISGLLLTSLFTWGPFYFAILHSGVGISLTINYAGIVIGMLFFGWLLAGEQFSKEKLISALLGILGLALIFSPTVSGFGGIALAAALLSGLSSGANGVFAKQIHYNSTQATILVWVTSIFANMLMAFVLGKSYPVFSHQIEWFYLALFALVSIVASWSFVRGVKLIDAGVAGILGLLEIVFGVVFGVLIFHERPSIIALMGMVLIIFAAAIPYLKNSKVESVS